MEVKQQENTILSNENVKIFINQIKELTDNKLQTFIMSMGHLNIILIGEDHFVMNRFFQDNKSTLQTVSELILSFSELNDTEVLIEDEVKEYEDTDAKLWHDFVQENDLVYGVSEEGIIQQSIISTLSISGSNCVKRMDNREEILGLEHDNVFLSNFYNSIANHFGFFGENQEQNRRVRDSILNQLDAVIIRKLVVYLLKNKESYTSNPVIKRVYYKLLDDTRYFWRQFINYVDEYQSYFTKEDKESISTMDEVVLEKIIYALVAKVLDFNIVKRIFDSEKKTFVIYTGLAHTFSIIEILRDCGFESSYFL